MGAGLLSLLLLSAVSLAVCDEVAEVLEDDLVVVEVGDYGSGSGEAEEEEELCDTGAALSLSAFEHRLSRLTL